MHYYMGTHRTQQNPKSTESSRPYKENGIKNSGNFGLYQMDFSLRVNRKQIATNSSPYRDQQFQHISSLRARFQRQGLPVISVDSKKRELIGNFKNSGVKWDRSPVRVNNDN